MPTAAEISIGKKNASDVELPKTDGWYTRSDASEQLGCSLQTLKNYEKRGLLNPAWSPRRDANGFERMMLVYNPRELTAIHLRGAPDNRQPHVLLREPGEQAARVFEMLRAGRSLDEIVIELRETPERIDYLNDRWMEQTQARYIISIEAKKELEQLVGAFDDVAALIEGIRKKLVPQSPQNPQ